MADFNKAIPIILKHEGGYVNNPKDPGGITNYGITLGFLLQYPEFGDLNNDGVVNAIDVKSMTQQQAINIYKTLWWDKFNFGLIENSTIATKLFDLSINMGNVRAGMLLQTALNKVCNTKLVVDGVFGTKSINTLNAITTKSTLQQVLTEFCNQTWAYYLSLIARRPSLAEFKNGWKNRAFDLSNINDVS